MYFVPKPQVAIFDVDKTTFKTQLFHWGLAESFNKLIPRSSHGDILSEIRLYDINNSGYNIAAHLDTYGLSFEKVKPQITATLSKMNLVYDDAVSTFNSILDTPCIDYWNLTVGITATQQFKIDLQNAELQRRLHRRIPSKNHVIISGNKGRYLTRHWSNGGFKMGRKKYSSAIVVDDNPVQLEGLSPTPGLKIYQIVRPRGLYEPTSRKDIIEISDLSAMIK